MSPRPRAHTIGYFHPRLIPSGSASTGTSTPPPTTARWRSWSASCSRTAVPGHALRPAATLWRSLSAQAETCRFYPVDIRLTGVEFSPAMLELARQRADTLGRHVDLRLGDAHELDLPEASFDTVVCTLSLCGIADDRRALAEMQRVLRP